MITCTFRSLYSHGNSLTCHLDGRLDDPRIGLDVKTKTVNLVLPRIEFHSSPWPVFLTELSQLKLFLKCELRFNHTISFLPVFDKHSVVAAEHIRITM